MNFTKLSKKFIFSIIILSIILGITYDIYLLINDEELSNIYNIFINIIFLFLFYYSEQIYEQKISFFPMSYYYVAALFSFFSMYLGSFLNYYEFFSWWDTLLHFTSGILLGYLSIIAVNLLFHEHIFEKRCIKEAKKIIVIGILCAISFGVFWEFYEFTFDFLTGGNMQRGFYIDDLNNVLDTNVRNSGRFIDPSLTDTMKDLFLSTIGAFISGIGAYLQINKNLKKVNHEGK